MCWLSSFYYNYDDNKKKIKSVLFHSNGLLTKQKFSAEIEVCLILKIIFIIITSIT